jgi:tRNA 2-thiouridine synthesizing protein A
MSESLPAATLDARGLKCPLPVLKARRALKDVPPGGTLRVLATDPGAEKDFAHFCATTGCELLQCAWVESELRIALRKPG